MPAAVARSSSTALNMNLFDRFSRVAKSNLNNVLKSLEDPEKIMTQALEDMQVGLTWQQERIEIEGWLTGFNVLVYIIVDYHQLTELCGIFWPLNKYCDRAIW